ncbi:MAG: nucleotide exchange factor GrpE [Candidatus Zophobacter franzmannii]|nr:nucleotide exchange factor GrpE [Candidatus Zophobacter franzmannii]
MSKKKDKKVAAEEAKELEKNATEEKVEETEVVEKTPPTPEERIAELEGEVKLWQDRYLRNMAEFDNFRRRSLKEKSDWIKTASEGIVLTICDVVDNFERAWSQASKEEVEQPFIKGVKQIEQQLVSILDREGVKKINSLNEEFNPTEHEALAHIPSDMDENIITAVIQNGYRLNGKIIRPARVAVSNGVKPEMPAENKENIEIEIKETED